MPCGRSQTHEGTKGISTSGGVAPGIVAGAPTAQGATSSPVRNSTRAESLAMVWVGELDATGTVTRSPSPSPCARIAA